MIQARGAADGDRSGKATSSGHDPGARGRGCGMLAGESYLIGDLRRHVCGTRRSRTANEWTAGIDATFSRGALLVCLRPHHSSLRR